MIAGLPTLVSIVVLLVLFIGCVGHNNFNNYQVIQSVTGQKSVRNEGGYYWKGFASVWTYPKTESFFFSIKDESGPEDHSIRGTFNDGGEAQISTMVRMIMPTEEKQRIELHERFKGDMNSIMLSVRAHLASCIKSTAPCMSATENQAARKSEFQFLVGQQLRLGLFAMKRVTRKVQVYDDVQERAVGTAVSSIPSPRREVELQGTEIIVDEKGQPVIAEPSPLTNYGLIVDQFSVTETDYDPKTKEQFAAKKELFLAAEKSKAEREQEIQQRLMVIERGLREKAEVEAVANKEKAKQVIDAQMKAEVALQTKVEQTTLAEMKVQLAVQSKLAAEQDKLAATEKAEAIKILAAAKEVEIAKAGVMREVDRVPLEIKRETEIGIATALSKINVPQTMIIGSGGGTGGSALENLLNMYLVKQMGVLGPDKLVAPVTAPK